MRSDVIVELEAEKEELKSKIIHYEGMTRKEKEQLGSADIDIWKEYDQRYEEIEDILQEYRNIKSDLSYLESKVDDYKGKYNG